MRFLTLLTKNYFKAFKEEWVNLWNNPFKYSTTSIVLELSNSYSKYFIFISISFGGLQPP